MSTPDLLTITSPPPWMAEGLCAQTDPELFYPEKGGSVREAKQVCSACPVRAACLTYALEHDEPHGVWGGHSERERRHLTRPASRPGPDQPGQAPGRWQQRRDRAAEISRLTAAGLSDRQTAERIGCTERTVLRIRADFAIPPSRPATHREVAA